MKLGNLGFFMSHNFIIRQGSANVYRALYFPNGMYFCFEAYAARGRNPR